MNQFLQAAIENMEWVEHDHDRERPIIDLRIQKTNEAIAYALIAIAEHLDARPQPLLVNDKDGLRFIEPPAAPF